MDTSIKLELVTPTQVVAELQVAEVVVSGLLGQFGVLPGHTPFISLLKPGTVSFQEGDKRRRVVVGKGFAEVGPDKVVILTDTAIDVANIDANALRAELEKDMARLSLLASGDVDYARIKEHTEQLHACLEAAANRSS